MASLSPQPAQRGSVSVGRSPWRVMMVAIILVYGVFLLVARDGQTMGVALRGSSSITTSTSTSTAVVHEERRQSTEEEEEEPVVEEWDPVPESPRTSYGNTPREPVKGGVEIYPIQVHREERRQPSRRARKATIPLVPEVMEIEGVPTAWKMPKEYAEGGGEAMKGLYVMFHGCNHGHMDWFDLPEERAIVSYLVNAGYAVVAPASKNRVSGCWKYNSEDGDVSLVRAMLWRWYRDWSIPPNTPLFLFGASSGGNMATMMASKGGFQLCEKRTTYVQVSGVMSQVSWGAPPSSYGAGTPPIAFMPMPKGEEVDQGETDAKNVPQVFGNSRKIPPQISSIAHSVRRSGGKPRMLLLPLGELAVYRAFFSDRVFEVGVCQCSGERRCFLVQDPRMSPLALDTLVTAYEESLARTTSSSSGAAIAVNDTSLAADSGAPQLSTRLEGGGAPLPSAQQQGGGFQNDPRFLGAASEETPLMTTAHATEVFRVRGRDVIECPQAKEGGGGVRCVGGWVRFRRGLRITLGKVAVGFLRRKLPTGAMEITVDRRGAQTTSWSSPYDGGGMGFIVMGNPLADLLFQLYALAAEKVLPLDYVNAA
ncbi:unnamed protein product [Ectocarpus sp. CCAP 1310/34]|nr:unnamed protein product [Ectocarpus sp. CCAP 1310/34]